MPQRALKVLAFNCSLKSANGREKSSTDVLLKELLDALEHHGAKGEIIRAVDHNIKPGERLTKVKATRGRCCASACWPPTSW
jgi:multimeric flavodoxin WrbA